MPVFIQLLFGQIDAKQLKRIHIFCFYSWNIRLEISTIFEFSNDQKLYLHPAVGRS